MTRRAVRWRPMIVRAAVLAGALGALGTLASCIEPDFQVCGNGMVCPASARCDEVHNTCVAPDQLVVCNGRDDGSDCTTAQVSGSCFDGVCLARGCGNRVVETGELCDDGNQLSGDGCSRDCFSTERCGDAARDPGETCDDGNLISRDGCDSRCQTEDAAWQVVPIAPETVYPDLTTYDPARGVLVTVTGTEIWEWDRVRWTTTPLELRPIATYFNTDLAEVELVALEPGSEVITIYGWRDGRWVARSHGAGPARTVLLATYDSQRHRVLALEAEYGITWTLDDTGAWTMVPDGPDTPILFGRAAIGYDAATGEVVIETDAGTEWIHDGTQWTSSSTSFGVDVSLAFDSGAGRLILTDNDHAVTYERIAGTWTAVPGGEIPCPKSTSLGGSALYYDTRTATRELLASDYTRICRWDGAWTSIVPQLPFRPIASTYDLAARRFVVFHSEYGDVVDTPLEAWTWQDDRWQRVTSEAPDGWNDALAVYSFGRAATVVNRGSWQACPSCEGDQMANTTWSFDGASWTAIGAPAAEFALPGRTAVYDPAHRRVVRAYGHELWGLGDADTAWTKLELASLTAAAGATINQLSWDARNSRLIAIALNMPTGSLFELRDTGWTGLDIVPAPFGELTARGVALVANQRAGGIIALDSSRGSIWERIGADWVRHPDAPVVPSESWGAYNPIDGSVLFAIRKASSGAYALIMTRTSATPLESCRAGDDLDGDGLAGCADPECYWACGGCLPYTSCP